MKILTDKFETKRLEKEFKKSGIKFSNYVFNNSKKELIRCHTLFAKAVLYDYGEIIAYSPYEHGSAKTKSKHTLTRAAVGGVVAGGVGTVVGAISGHDKQFDILTDMGVNISLKNGEMINISFAVNGIKSNSAEARNHYNMQAKLCALLDSITLKS